MSLPALKGSWGILGMCAGEDQTVSPSFEVSWEALAGHGPDICQGRGQADLAGEIQSSFSLPFSIQSAELRMKCHGVLTDGSSKDPAGWQRGVELGRGCGLPAAKQLGAG